MSDDRYTARFKLIATYLDTELDDSDYDYYIPQAPAVSIGPPTGSHFAVLIQRGKIVNELDGGDTCFYSDRINYEIYILINDGIFGDKDKATYMNIAVDEVISALRHTDVGDPPFGIDNADQQRIESSAPGTYNGTTAEKIVMSILHDETY